MFIYQNAQYEGEVRLKMSPQDNYELVSPEGVTVVVGTDGGELIDLVDQTKGLRWEG